MGRRKKEDSGITQDLFNGIDVLNKDAKKAISNLDANSARMLVDNYYQIQDIRKRLGNQITAVSTGSDVVLDQFNITNWLYDNFYGLEKEITKALNIFTDSQPVGAWMKSIKGIGPVLSAGCLAYFDITKASKPTCFWQYGGLNKHNRPWHSNTNAAEFIKQAKAFANGDESDYIAKLSELSGVPVGQLYGKNDTEIRKELVKPPHNLKLRTILWLMGQSFIKVCNRGSLYGRLIVERKVYENEMNEKGMYKAQADEILSKHNIGKTTDAYKAYIVGKLPKAHIQQRCENYAVRIFLDHLWKAMYYATYKKEADFKSYCLDYPTRQLDGSMVKHVEYIEPEIDYVEFIDNFKKK